MPDQIQIPDPPLDRVDELLHRTARAQAPPDVERRLQPHFDAFREKLATAPAQRNFTLSRFNTRFAVFAASAVIVVAAALILLPMRSSSAHAYAKAAAELRSAQSLQYTIEVAPYTTVDFAYAAPAFRRVALSWGMEVRSDGSGRELVLMHANRTFILEENKKQDSAAEAADTIEQFRALPRDAGEFLGQQTIDGRQLEGFRVHPENSTVSAKGPVTFDLWVDAATSNPDHIDITFHEPQKPAYGMHIRNIRVDGAVDQSIFEMQPPAGYTRAQPTTPSQSTQAGGASSIDLHPVIATSAAQTAVVLPMKGSFQQTRAALNLVEAELSKLHVAPTGSAFGTFASESDWRAGYPVPAGTRVSAPFEVIELPSTEIASVKVRGAWGENSGPRWSALLNWVIESGYSPSGPPTEIWTGPASNPASQVTEMRIAVSKRQ